MDGTRVRAGVDQFLRIDPRRGRAGDVAHIVRPRALRGEAQIDQTQHHLRCGMGGNVTDLQIGARGHIGETAAKFIGDIGHTPKLRGAENAAGNPQAAHIGVLRWPDIEQAVEADEEIVRPLGELALGGHRLDLREAVERVLLPLRLFLRHQLATSGDHAILRCAVDVGRVGRGGIGDWGERQTKCRPARLNAGHETFEIFLLLSRKWLIAHAAISFGAKARPKASTGRNARTSWPSRDLYHGASAVSP